WVDGWRGGLLSGLLAIAFFAYDVAVPGQPPQFAVTGNRQLVALIISLPVIVLMVGTLRSRVKFDERRGREPPPSGRDAAAPRVRRDVTRELIVQVAEADPDGILVITPDGRAIFANEAAERILGV